MIRKERNREKGREMIAKWYLDWNSYYKWILHHFQGIILIDAELFCMEKSFDCHLDKCQWDEVLTFLFEGLYLKRSNFNSNMTLRLRKYNLSVELKNLDRIAVFYYAIL